MNGDNVKGDCVIGAVERRGKRRRGLQQTVLPTQRQVDAFPFLRK